MSHLNLIQFYTEQESALYIKQLQKNVHVGIWVLFLNFCFELIPLKSN